MEEFTQFIVAHGYLLLAGWVFLDQLGVPIPDFPVLIAGGALVGTGQLHPAAALAAATLGAIPSDLGWDETGRRLGAAPALQAVARARFLRAQHRGDV